MTNIDDIIMKIFMDADTPHTILTMRTPHTSYLPSSHPCQLLHLKALLS